MQVIGIEIGGTKLQLGRADQSTGKLIELRRASINRSDGASGILKSMSRILDEWLPDHHPGQIGIGFGGPINSASGTVTTSHQVPGWDDFPIVDWMQDHFAVPTVLGNDCDLACLAESRLGAGKDAGSVFYVTVGTGIGGGFTNDDRLFGLERPAIAEIGHLRPGGPGSAETVEDCASGLGIERRLDRILNESALEPLLPEEQIQDLRRKLKQTGSPVSAQHLAQCAAEGQPIARRLFDDAARVLGWALAQVMTLMAPEVIVIGGGVSLADPSVFLGPVRQYALTDCFPPLRDSLRIEPAALGEDVVVRGAVELARLRISGGITG